MTTSTCILIMGVAGAGKTTVGRRLADRLGGDFIDGDDLHPPANITKMTNATPLNDSDRWPWLDSIVEAVREKIKDRPVVVGCSALKESYRHRLAEIPYHLVYLKGCPDEIAVRLRNRAGHFMPTKLIDSQFSDLEEPKDALIVPVAWTPEKIIEHIIRELPS